MLTMNGTNLLQKLLPFALKRELMALFRPSSAAVRFASTPCSRGSASSLSLPAGIARTTRLKVSPNFAAMSIRAAPTPDVYSCSKEKTTSSVAVAALSTSRESRRCEWLVKAVKASSEPVRAWCTALTNAWSSKSFSTSLMICMTSSMVTFGGSSMSAMPGICRRGAACCSMPVSFSASSRLLWSVAGPSSALWDCTSFWKSTSSSGELHLCAAASAAERPARHRARQRQGTPIAGSRADGAARRQVR
mmetsp:Transcript_63321/g.196472  ORF Transcript_63321/g.196472 Transcript_63321/m.196472 type:complete len:248 (-) Transcript_63321:26-769(-)